jgi:hypothetical protein
VAQVSVVETTSGTSNALFFNDLFLDYHWGRLDINWRGRWGGCVLDNDHLHVLSDENFLLSTAHSTESHTNDKNTAEQEGTAAAGHPDLPPLPFFCFDN